MVREGKKKKNVNAFFANVPHRFHNFQKKGGGSNPLRKNSITNPLFSLDGFPYKVEDCGSVRISNSDLTKDSLALIPGKGRSP